jgi:hypothetical protein
MTDRFLSDLRESPRPAFAEALKQRLDAIEREQAERAAGRPLRLRLRPVFAGVAALAAVAVALSVPTVRASARSLLEIFRVKRFAAVPVDMSRLRRLHDQQLDLRTLISDNLQVLQDPGAPLVVADVAEAAGKVGFEVAQPAQLPQDYALSEVRVTGKGSFKATLDMDRLEQLASALGVTDIAFPHELNGASVAIQTSPSVILRYTRGKDEFRLFQALSPEVALPEGIDIRQLGAIGLQLAGMSAEEAQLFASKVDWRTTLLVPVPAMGGDFRDVAVGDAQGLLVTVRPPRRESGDAQRPMTARGRSVLLWSKGERIFALQGPDGRPGAGIELLEMANEIG